MVGFCCIALLGGVFTLLCWWVGLGGVDGSCFLSVFLFFWWVRCVCLGSFLVVERFSWLCLLCFVCFIRVDVQGLWLYLGVFFVGVVLAPKHSCGFVLLVGCCYLVWVAL